VLGGVLRYSVTRVSCQSLSGESSLHSMPSPFVKSRLNVSDCSIELKILIENESDVPRA
jgi:hypothetical protein